MPTIRAEISFEGSTRECDKLFASKRDAFLGVIDNIHDITSSRRGTWHTGFTTYTFYCSCTHADAPVVLGLFRDAAFATAYL